MRLPGCTFVHTTAVGCKWDPAKANLTKHEVHFADAVSALEDDSTLTIRDPHSEHAERWITLGMDALGRLLVVVYAWRAENLGAASHKAGEQQYDESHHE